jgi:hypothetical protein
LRKWYVSIVSAEPVFVYWTSVLATKPAPRSAAPRFEPKEPTASFQASSSKASVVHDSEPSPDGSVPLSE